MVDLMGDSHMFVVHLQVPSDAHIALAVLQAERDAQMTVEVSPPSLEQDMQPEGNKGRRRLWENFSCAK